MANDLYEDMRILNSLYEELCWSPNAPLQFTADYTNNCIIITEKIMPKGKGTYGTKRGRPPKKGKK